MCLMPTATRCEMDSSRITLVPRQMYPLGICLPNTRMRMPMPAASMIALGTTELIIFFHQYTLADPLGLISSGGNSQKYTPVLNQALPERVPSEIGRNHSKSQQFSVSRGIVKKQSLNENGDPSNKQHTDKQRSCKPVFENGRRRITHRPRDIAWCDQPSDFS